MLPRNDKPINVTLKCCIVFLSNEQLQSSVLFIFYFKICLLKIGAQILHTFLPVYRYFRSKHFSISVYLVCLCRCGIRSAVQCFGDLLVTVAKFEALAARVIGCSGCRIRRVQTTCILWINLVNCFKT